MFENKFEFVVRMQMDVDGCRWMLTFLNLPGYLKLQLPAITSRGRLCKVKVGGARRILIAKLLVGLLCYPQGNVKMLGETNQTEAEAEEITSRLTLFR